MARIRLTCPGCGAALRAPEDGAGRTPKCPRCGTLVEMPLDAAAPMQGEETEREEAGAEEVRAAAPRGAVGLRARLALNALRRCPLSIYCAARTRGERHALWVRILACLLPFGIGGLVSWCLWLFLPEAAAFEGAIGVLLLTVACGGPLLVVFFPGSRAQKARRSLERLRADARDMRAELAGGRAGKAEMHAARAAERARWKREQAPEPKRVASAGPRYGVVRLFSVSAYVLGAMQVALAGVLALRAVRQGGRGPVITVFMIEIAWTGLLLLFVGQLLGLLRDAGRNLWRIGDTLGEIRDHLARDDGKGRTAAGAPHSGGGHPERERAAALLKAYADGTIGGGEVIKRFPGGRADDLLDAIVSAFCQPVQREGVDVEGHYRLVARNGLQAIEEGWDAEGFRRSLPPPGG